MYTKPQRFQDQKDWHTLNKWLLFLWFFLTLIDFAFQWEKYQKEQWRIQAERVFFIMLWCVWRYMTSSTQYILYIVYFHKSIHSSEKIVLYVLNEMFLPNALNSFRFLVSNNSVTIFLAFRWNISSIINLPVLQKMDRICTIILLQIKEDLEKTYFRILETRHITIMLHCVFNSWI